MLSVVSNVSMAVLGKDEGCDTTAERGAQGQEEGSSGLSTVKPLERGFMSDVFQNI